MNQLVIRIKRFARLEFRLFSMWFMRMWEYRTDAMMNIVASILWTMGSILFIEFLFNKIQLVAGWDKWDLLLLLGISQFFAYLYFLFTFKNIRNLEREIEIGKFDWYVLKPVNKFFYPILNKFEVSSILALFAPFAILWYVFENKHYDITLQNVLLFVLTLFISNITVHFLQVISVIPTFWTVKTDTIRFFDKTSDITRYPFEVFSSKISKIVFFVILPYALIINIPFRALIGVLNPWLFVLHVFVCIMFFLLARYLWNKGLRIYSSVGN